MILKLEIYGALCSTSVFKINGIDADSDDFGSQGDNDKDGAEDYGCGDMTFERNQPGNAILEKYKITEKEYHQIAQKLEDGLSFGSCGWCA